MEGLACADPGARTPIDTSGIFVTVDTCVEVDQDVLRINLYSPCLHFIVHLIDIYSAPYTPTSPENTLLYPRNVFLPVRNV